MVWARASSTSTAIGATGYTEDALGNLETALGANLIGCTVVRVRGVIDAFPSVTSANAAMIAGLRVGSSSDTAGEGPYTLPYEDWSMFEPFLFQIGDTRDMDKFHRVIDVKSMRKVEEVNQAFRLFFEPGTPGPLWLVSWWLSILVKLP